MSVLLEYIIVFVFVYIIQYCIALSNKKKGNKKELTMELMYLKKVYHVNVKKIDYNKFVYVQCFINSFIIATIYIILMYLLNNWVIRIIIGIVLLILMIIICYGLLGRYYLGKEGNRDV